MTTSKAECLKTDRVEVELRSWKSLATVGIFSVILLVLSRQTLYQQETSPAKIEGARSKLPATAKLISIPGANYLSFGNYGLQKGGGEMHTTDEEIIAIYQANFGSPVDK